MPLHICDTADAGATGVATAYKSCQTAELRKYIIAADVTASAHA